MISLICVVSAYARRRESEGGEGKERSDEWVSERGERIIIFQERETQLILSKRPIDRQVDPEVRAKMRREETGRPARARARARLLQDRRRQSDLTLRFTSTYRRCLHPACNACIAQR